jgi:hypothetical protein
MVALFIGQVTAPAALPPNCLVAPTSPARRGGRARPKHCPALPRAHLLQPSGLSHHDYTRQICQGQRQSAQPRGPQLSLIGLQCLCHLFPKNRLEDRHQNSPVPQSCQVSWLPSPGPRPWPARPRAPPSRDSGRHPVTEYSALKSPWVACGLDISVCAHRVHNTRNI